MDREEGALTSSIPHLVLANMTEMTPCQLPGEKLRHQDYPC